MKSTEQDQIPAVPETLSEKVYFCVFVESGYEETVARTIQYCNYGRAFFPQRIKPVHRHGVWVDEKRALFPGYVFVEGESLMPQLTRINHVIRLLHYEDKTVQLRDSDLAFAKMLFLGDGSVRKLKTVQEGSYIRVTDDLLKNFNGRVLRVDKRKRIAEVEITLVGTVNRVWLGLDMMEPAPEAEEDTTPQPEIGNDFKE